MRAEVEREGSELAGSWSEPPRTTGCQPEPMPAATTEGMMAIRDEGMTPASRKRWVRDLSTNEEDREERDCRTSAQGMKSMSC